MLQITYHGRLGNTLFLCVGASMLARRYDLKVISYNIPVYEYPHTELSEIQKYLGIELFCGNAGYNEWAEITDKNLIQALNGEFKNKAFHINKSKDTYFQIKPFVLEYKQEIRDHFKNLKYDNYVSKDDVLLHLRLGDKANSIGRDVPDLKYYHECFNKITFKNGYIMTDTPEHSLVKELNAKQKESYNFQKISGVLADYGYFPIRLSDDWESADFICIKCTTKKFLKVQLKGSFTLDKKYVGKDLYIAFQNKKTGQWYLYPHDYIVKKYTEDKGLENKGSWVKIGYIFNNPPTNYDLSILEPFKL